MTGITVWGTDSINHKEQEIFEEYDNADKIGQEKKRQEKSGIKTKELDKVESTWGS